MGTHQKKVYQYHLDADYRDVNGVPAIGAQLQALRIAAADPSSVHLTAQPGEPAEPCDCARLGAPKPAQAAAPSATATAPSRSRTAPALPTSPRRPPS